jgi:hypothetical protein
MLEIKIYSNRLLAVAVAGITLLLVLLSVISIQYTNRMVSQYSTLVATSTEVKLEIATAHLWFEEIISGDKNESMQTVWHYHNEASHHIDMILEGSNDSLNTAVPVDSPVIRQDINEVKNKLAVFRDITLERFKSKENAGVGTEIDQEYDAIFVNLLNQMDKVNSEVAYFIDSDYCFANRRAFISLSKTSNNFI